MVLRGSGIKPKSSLTDLEDHLLELEEKIDYIQKEIQIQVLRLRRLGKIANDEGFENVNDEFERCCNSSFFVGLLYIVAFALSTYT